MTLTLSDCYTDNKTLFLKYPEPLKDSHHGDKFDFYAGDYGPQVIHTEEARFLPIIGDKINMLVGEGALTKEMVDYYKSIYPDTFSDKNIISYKDSEYYEKITREVKDKTLIVLHPYTKIDPRKYSIHPDLIFGLNDKANMCRLTSSIPKHSILSLDEIKDIDCFPFVLKTHSGASGDGVRIIHTKEDLNKALNYFKNESELLVENFINIKHNYNVQLIIGDNGDIKILGVSFQDTTKKGEYNGNYIYGNTKLPQKVKNIVFEVGKNAYNEGYRGICGLDIVIDTEGKSFMIDPNFRLNGSTSALMLKDKIFHEKKSSILKLSGFDSNHPDIKTMLLENIKLGQDSLYILSSYRNKSTGTIHGHCITFGEDSEDLDKRVKYLTNKGFRI